MTIPHIYCFAASDRYNYGDLLFPIVAQHQLQKCGAIEFTNVAMIESDLSDVGALPTVGYDILLDEQKQPKHSTLLVSGGQVLNCDWMRLLSFIKPRWHSLYERRNSETLKRRIYNMFNLQQEPLPFMPSTPNVLTNNQVVYHAVGGSSPAIKNRKMKAKAALSTASYVSVREKWSQVNMRTNLEINPTLLPDSVIVYSDIMPKSKLKPQVDEAYICVQFGFQKSQDKLQILLAELRELHQSLHYKIGLLSIGNCPGHDDEVTADWIIENADFPVFKLKHDHIDDITSALAHASLFIGTSLHGVIVSMTYGNPFVAVNKQINKLNAYTNTWAPNYLKGCVAYSEIARSAKQRLAAHHDYSKVVEQQKQMVRNSFKHIYELASDYLANK